MKNALILHGAGNDSSGNWFPWLKAELEKQQYKVFLPDLPNSDHPNKKLWLETISQNWKFDENSVLVGHSSGAALILRILEQLPKGLKIKKAILVAGMVELGTNPEYFKYKESLVKDPFNWQKIKESAKDFIFIHSDNDPYECGEAQGKILQANLGGKLIILLGEGHFNLEVGDKYKRFPHVLKLILKNNSTLFFA